MTLTIITIAINTTTITMKPHIRYQIRHFMTCLANLSAKGILSR
jgi:hypothetical protein